MAFCNIGYKIQIGDETIGYTDNKDKIQNLVDTYLQNTKCLNGGYIEMNKNIEYKFAIFFKGKEIKTQDLIYYIHNNSLRYYKTYLLEDGMGNELSFLTYNEAQNILDDLCEFDKDAKINILEHYDTYLNVSSNEEVSNLVEQYKEYIVTNYRYSFKKPTASGIVTSRYGSRWGRTHTGIDIADNLGTKITAAQDGMVIFAGDAGAYGNLIQIEHQYGYVTYYAHCNKILVKKGQTVEQGQLIARMGSTGRSTGTHVHFEIRLNGIILNPYDCIFER